MFLDYYAATVEADPHTLAKLLEEGSEDSSVRSTDRGWKQYTDGLACTASGAHVYFGGANPHPHVRASGDGANGVAQVLRRHFPGHRVSRMDSAFDFASDQAWEGTVSDLTDRARQHRLSTRLIGSPTDPEKGQTLYVGSRNSAVFLRAYQKGRQLREQGWSSVCDQETGAETFQKGWQGDPECATAPDPRWVRVEIEYKPDKRAEKAAAAHLTPKGVWQRRGWTSALYEHLTGSHAPYLPPARVAPNETLASLRHMMDQYGSTLARACDEFGTVAMERHLMRWLHQSASRKGRGG